MWFLGKQAEKGPHLQPSSEGTVSPEWRIQTTGLLTFQLVVLKQELLHLLHQLLRSECVQAGVNQTGGSISWGFTGAVPLLSQAAQRLMGHGNGSYGKATSSKHSCPQSVTGLGKARKSVSNEW